MKKRHATKIILLFFFCLPYVAQSQVAWEIKAGVNMSDLSSTTAKTKVGPLIGVGCSYDLTSRLVLASGIELSTKGGNNIKSAAGYSEELKICDVNLYYLQLPLTIGYKLALKEQIHLIPQAGLYFAYGMWGYGELTAISFKPEEIFRVYEDTWNPFQAGEWNDWSKTRVKAFERFDYGLRLGIDTQVYRFIFHLAYDLGLHTVWEGYHSAGLSIANRNFTIGIGYKF